MKLFQSATLKLAGWYLLILMTVSLLFSVVIYQVALSEVDARLQRIVSRSRNLPDKIPTSDLEIVISDDTTAEQLEAASANLLISLGYINLVILLTGGAGAYFLARRTLEPIEAAHAAQARFTANASHQLRTPLAIMKAETELILANSRSSKAELREILESNLEEVNRLKELTDMLLELSRSEQQLASSTEPFDLTELISNLVQSRGEQRLRLDTPDSLKMTLNRPAVREVVAVLIDNALKHSPADSPIDISLKRQRQQAVLTVTNQGAIPPGDLPHIFERFYQAEQKSHSYGLGLSLARQLARTLGGQIDVKSTETTTTFSVILPLT